MGLQIFLHSLRLVFSHFPVAFRISLPVIGAIVLGAAGSLLFANDIAGLRDGTPNVGAIGVVVVGLIVWTAGSIWTAVAWHRYVLLDEEPGEVLPPLHRDQMLAYFGKWLLIVLVLVVSIAALMLLLFLVASATGSPAIFMLMIVAMFIAVLVSYRLSPMVVAAAVGNRLTLGDAWAATKGATGQILLLVIVTGLCGWLIDLPVYLLPSNTLGGLLALIWMAGTYWVKTMAGISILTTIYGYYVEGRPLPKGGAQAS
jgi:hypothetical protein